MTPTPDPAVAPPSGEGRSSVLRSYIEFLHPGPIIAVLVTLTALTIVAAGGRPAPGQVVPLVLSVLLTQLAVSFHNDYCDVELDRRTKPWRVIPRGLVARSTALRMSIVLVVIGVAVAAVLGPVVMACVALGTSAAFVYNAWLKRTTWSWLMFWLALPLIPISAFAAVQRLMPALWLTYVIAFPLALAIHVVDSLPDLQTDAAHDVRGLPHRLGPVGARLACWAGIAIAVGVALALWPGEVGYTRGVWLSPLLLGAAIVLDRLGRPRGHWVGIMASAALLAVAWMAALVAEGDAGRFV